MSTMGTYYAGLEKRKVIDFPAGTDEWVEETVDTIKRFNPDISDLEARIREVILRFRGESGLSAYKVNYITSAIMRVVDVSLPQIQADR